MAQIFNAKKAKVYMEDSGKASVPPKQVEGIKKDLEETTSFETIEDAEDMFVVAKKRLLHVNDWHSISESLKSRFQLTDHHGAPVSRSVHHGDLISIEIPAPATDTGEGKDWVVVEALEYDDYPDENREVIAMRLRPVPDPRTKDESVAHFFSDKSTSTFVIERDQKKITARYHGRNEKPNIETEGIVDKIRNAAVSLGALLGFSDVQWKGLLQGLIKEEE
jgi:hypothetical protein